MQVVLRLKCVFICTISKQNTPAQTLQGFFYFPLNYGHELRTFIFLALRVLACSQKISGALFDF